ncbi:MAG: helix-turn-helix domain-containing protein [Nitrososphaerota archaeon]
MTNSEESLMSLDDAAKYLRVSRRTVSRYFREFGLPCLRGPGGKMYFKASDVRGWFEKVTREYMGRRGRARGPLERE